MKTIIACCFFVGATINYFASPVTRAWVHHPQSMDTCTDWLPTRACGALYDPGPFGPVGSGDVGRDLKDAVRM